MAAGIGEASAIATFLQIGFSLAKTLSTYIADFKDTPSEISGLAEEINVTLGHVEELNVLLDNNQNTQVWNDKGVVWAKKCRTDSERLVQKLLQLLQKAGTSVPPNGTIGRQDIDISLFNRASWPRLRPQIELVQKELERNRINILLAISFYKAKSAPSQAAQRQASSRIGDLVKESRLARRRLRKARRQQDLLTRPQSPPRLRFELPDDRRGRERSRAASRSPPAHRRGVSPSGSTYSTSTSTSIEEAQIAEIESEVRLRISREEETRRVEERNRQALEAEAVRKYKESVVNKVASTKEQAEKLEQNLTGAFQHALSKEEIADYVKAQQAKETGDEVFDIIAALDRESGIASLKSPSSATHIGNTKHNGWYWGLKRLAATSEKSASSAAESQVPVALRYHHSIEGCANVTSISAAFDGDQWHILPVHIPMHWLIDRMRKEEEISVDDQGRSSHSLREYLALPDACRIAAQDWLQQAIGHQREFQWILVYAHALRKRSSKGRRIARMATVGLQEQAEPHSVLLVFRASREASGVVPTAGASDPQLPQQRPTFPPPPMHMPPPSFGVPPPPMGMYPPSFVVPPPPPVSDPYSVGLGPAEPLYQQQDSHLFGMPMQAQPSDRHESHQSHGADETNAFGRQAMPVTNGEPGNSQPAAGTAANNDGDAVLAGDRGASQELPPTIPKLTSPSVAQTFASISLTLESGRWKVLPARLSKVELDRKMKNCPEWPSVIYNSLPIAARAQTEEWLSGNMTSPSKCELLYAERVGASVSKRTKLLRRVLLGADPSKQGGSVLLVFSGKIMKAWHKANENNDRGAHPKTIHMAMPTGTRGDVFPTLQGHAQPAPHGYPSTVPPVFGVPFDPDATQSHGFPIDPGLGSVPMPPPYPPCVNPFVPDPQFVAPGQYSPVLDYHTVQPPVRISGKQGPSSHAQRADRRRMHDLEVDIDGLRGELRTSRDEVERIRHNADGWKRSLSSSTLSSSTSSIDRDYVEVRPRSRRTRSSERTTTFSGGYPGPSMDSFSRSSARRSFQAERNPRSAESYGHSSAYSAITGASHASSQYKPRNTPSSYIGDYLYVHRMSDSTPRPRVSRARRVQSPIGSTPWRSGRRSPTNAHDQESSTRYDGDQRYWKERGERLDQENRERFARMRRPTYESSLSARLERVEELSESSKSKGKLPFADDIMRDPPRSDGKSIREDSSDDDSMLSVGIDASDLGQMMLVKFTGDKNDAFNAEAPWEPPQRSFIADASGHVTVQQKTALLQPTTQHHAAAKDDRASTIREQEPANGDLRSHRRTESAVEAPVISPSQDDVEVDTSESSSNAPSLGPDDSASQTAAIDNYDSEYKTAIEDVDTDSKDAEYGGAT